MKKLILLNSLLVVALLFASCKDPDAENDNDTVNFAPAPSASILTLGTADVITENTIRYHFLTVGGLSSTIVESESGITIVDVGAPLFEANAGTELKLYADAINKPISIILTHDHYDHYGNISHFTDATVYAEVNAAADLMGDSGFTDLYSNTVIPVNASQVIEGIHFHFENFENAETNENGYVYIPDTKALFPGDLVYGEFHHYIKEYTPLDGIDELTNWIDALNFFKDNFADYNHVFAGHGGRATDIPTIIDKNINYLTDAQGLIKGTKPLTSGGIATTNQEVVDELTLLYPHYAVGARDLSLPSAGDPGAIWF